jgi:protein tyrosine/serine phosphatase
MNKKLQATVACALLALSAYGAYRLYFYLTAQNPKFNFAIVEPGKIYRSGQPEPGDLKRIAEKYGIKTVVSLSKKGVENDDLKELDQKLGIDVAGVKADPKLVPGPGAVKLVIDILTGQTVSRAEFKDLIGQWPGLDDQALRLPGPVLVHCQKGMDRTGYMVGIYRVCVQGWPVEKAAVEMRSHYKHLFFTDTPILLQALKNIQPARYCPQVYPAYKQQ